LLRLARAQLHDEQLADDVVQDAVLSAWQALEQFERRSSLRTWLVGILRFKILDALRDRNRQPINLSALTLDEELQSLEDDLLFDAQGRWREMPLLWGGAQSEPSEALYHKQGIQILKLCLQQLPEKTGQVFLMREYLGFDGAEVARQTGLQAGHVRVILMRARLALRSCLEWRMSGSADMRSL
jgi:RNA polymerase sigma-70 factor (ECF subfamily)